MPKPEDRARRQIDESLDKAGWIVQDHEESNIFAGRGIAVREYPLRHGHGTADYLLYVEGKAAGVVEAKKAGTTLTVVEPQAARYGAGLPDALPAHHRPLPFLYQATGAETRFTNWLDPEPRSRPVFSFHRPEVSPAVAVHHRRGGPAPGSSPYDMDPPARRRGLSASLGRDQAGVHRRLAGLGRAGATCQRGPVALKATRRLPPQVLGAHHPR
jgi:hypothetical protein